MFGGLEEWIEEAVYLCSMVWVAKLGKASLAAIFRMLGVGLEWSCMKESEKGKLQASALLFLSLLSYPNSRYWLRLIGFKSFNIHL